jgi:hypothetical protein
LILYIAILFSAAMLRKKTSVSVVSIIAILVTSLAVTTLGEFGIFGIARSQGNDTTSLLTPDQKAAICSSVGSHVNTTESRICGIPTTPSSNTTSSQNTTTGAEAPAADAGE